MHRFLFLTLGSAVVTLSTACHTTSGTAQLRAANDFQCPEDKVNVTNIGGTSYRAEGCGKTAVYTCNASDSVNGQTTTYACVPEGAPQSAGAPPPAH